jgi:hypothetical protein
MKNRRKAVESLPENYWQPVRSPSRCSSMPSKIVNGSGRNKTPRGCWDQAMFNREKLERIKKIPDDYKTWRD